MSDHKPVHLIGPYPPPYGGVAVHVEGLLGCIPPDERRMRLMGYGDWAKPPDGGKRLGARVSPAAIGRLAASAPSGALLHDHSTLPVTPSPQSAAAFEAAHRLKRWRWIATIHDGTWPERFAKYEGWRRKLVLRLAERAERFIFVSEELRDFAESELGLKGGSVIPPLLPLPRNAAAKELPAGIERIFSSHDRVWIACGAMIPNYDFPTIASAILEEKQDGANVALILFDGGFESDAATTGTVARTLSCLGESAVVLKSAPRAVVLGAMLRSGLCIRGVREESFGLSRIEALWAGCRLVATPTGLRIGAVEYAFGDAQSLRAAMKKAIKTPIDFFSKAAEEMTRQAARNMESIKALYAELD
ncbi:MAG TPA: hypothetical protein PL033_11620 [Candidatus Brocadiia bacterium]|nr:hypothetical protein [Candidatus Brocadiia bacterium]